MNCFPFWVKRPSFMFSPVQIVVDRRNNHNTLQLLRNCKLKTFKLAFKADSEKKEVAQPL